MMTMLEWLAEMLLSVLVEMSVRWLVRLLAVHLSAGPKLVEPEYALVPVSVR
jgi:hypothetical protein